MTTEHLPDIPIAEIEARMRPGALSQSGFLAPAERLQEVLDADARALQTLGVTAGALAAKLGKLLTEALDTKREISQIGHHRVVIRRFKGSQVCPFAPRLELPCQPPGDVRLASIDWTIDNVSNRTRLSGPGLIVHLIGAHGFFEGPGSPYRVSPGALAALMGNDG
jgi:hypothetical protein